ncbi:hypothetical protein PC113_g1764 [Phytophthora cactorum]|uniref:Uncharacterized protein n=1 Tax=Phytophthora cactorum TaxID=29920 RepID=A0A8T1E049_9STRA|nr:hypothetical protein PC113_g1764 [Phytophthora cactorum]KAG2941790.1 hypothetical protein PC115_g1718 [Phytophthora cactorum]KAG2946612.1 hypothetical protein PC117_g7464 [Phytophthora cactorum]KAG3203995.1 hypothetical protein PC128_g2220 [Phytophthora cactorum]
MVFIAPKLSAEQALVIVGSLLLAARGNRKRFLRTMYFLITSPCFRLRDPPPRINTGNHFDPTMDDVTARTRFNFTRYFHQPHHKILTLTFSSQQALVKCTFRFLTVQLHFDLVLP